MKDLRDMATFDMIGAPKLGRGRPAKYHTIPEKRAAAARAARMYRQRVKAEKKARKAPNKPKSKIIDLTTDLSSLLSDR